METNGAATTTTSSNGNVSTSSTIKAVSKPGRTAWRYINYNNAFSNGLNYDTTSLSKANLDSHLIKNSEWGAVAYLSHSKYGRNKTERASNSNSNYYTAGGSGATTHTNVLQSTTGNCYGIFDMNGCSRESVAAYVSGWSTGGNGESLINADSKYKDVYDQPDSSTDYGEKDNVRVYGDAIWETSPAVASTWSDTPNQSWFADWSRIGSVWGAFLCRDHDWGHANGIFGFGSTGLTLDENISFRVVLWGE